MGTISYKGMTLNDPTDPSGTYDWGPTELQAWQDHTDWIGGDCLSTSLDTAGHKHTKIYDGYGDDVINSNNITWDLRLGRADDNKQNVNIYVGNIDTYDEFKLMNSDDAEAIKFDGLNRGLFIGEDCQYTRFYVPEDQPMPFTLQCITGGGNETIIEIATSIDNEYVKIGANGSGSPLIFDKDSDIYTKDALTIDHTVYGTSASTHVLMAKTLGSIMELSVNISGTFLSGAESFYVILPFRLETTIDSYSSDYEPIAIIPGKENGASIPVKVLVTNYDTAFTQMHFVPSDENDIASWAAGDFEIIGRMMFNISDPEFVNSVS